MKFALIGCSDVTLKLAAGLMRSGAHTISRVHSADPFRTDLFELAPAAKWEDHWESLLVGDDIHAAIVTRHADEPVLAEQLRKLVQAGVPLIAVQPLCDSLLAYELEMMREEAHSVIVPYVPGWSHPALARMVEMIEQGADWPIGDVEQVTFERFLPVRDKNAVLTAFARDVSLLRTLIGPITSINAVGSDVDDTAFGTFAVSVTGSAELLARWSVAPAASDGDARITLLGSKGKVVILAHGDDRAWTMTLDGANQTETFATWDDSAMIVEQLREALTQPDKSSAWEAACRDLEVAELAERSLRRKRTVELRRQAQTEEGTFKGLMSAGGCVILMLAFFLMVVWAVVEGFRMPDIDPQVLREQAGKVPRAHFLIRMWPVYPLLAFLLLQLLLLVAKRSKQRDQSLARPEPD